MNTIPECYFPFYAYPGKNEEAKDALTIILKPKEQILAMGHLDLPPVNEGDNLPIPLCLWLQDKIEEEKKIVDDIIVRLNLSLDKNTFCMLLSEKTLHILSEVNQYLNGGLCTTTMSSSGGKTLYYEINNRIPDNSFVITTYSKPKQQ